MHVAPFLRLLPALGASNIGGPQTNPQHFSPARQRARLRARTLDTSA
jgi:hypothetical protein